MAEIFPWQKWSISYLWENFLVLEHQTPIWLYFVLGFSVELMKANHSSLDTRTQTCFQNVLDHQSCDTCTRTEPNLQIQRTLELESWDMCTYMTKLKLDKEFGGGVLLFWGIASSSCMRYYIPLCLDCEFQDASRDAAPKVPTSNSGHFSSSNLVS